MSLPMYLLHTVQTKVTSGGSSHEQTVMHLTRPSHRHLLTHTLCKHLSFHIRKSTVKISTFHYRTFSSTGFCVWQHCLMHTAFLKLQCFTNTRLLSMINKNTSLMQLISINFTYGRSLHVSGRTLPIISRIRYCTYQRLVLVR